ncbi:class I SAM-dependent methyltransferase [Candidatus Woesebacteria bacterium]|nr:MAG: class I SAM-dependent methyltransferase [Candidatus Woesebacteria bacterium]
MTCKYCKSDKYKHLFEVNGKDIVECLECGLVRTNCRDFEKYDNYHRDDKEYRSDEELFKNIFIRRFQTISRYKKKGKILDIGSSTGTMLSIFKDHGWQVWGVEPSASFKYANKKGIKTTNSTFEKAKLPLNYFDVVIMNHTFEHVEDPVAVVKKIYAVLKIKGLVYIDVPNFGGFDAKIRGNNWGYLMPNEHVHHFTPNTLKMIIRKAGFEIVWWGSWSGIFDVASIGALMKFNLVNLRKAFFKNIVYAPFNLITTCAKRGSSLAVIGIKK